jgi:hypothetical protein
MGEKTETYTCIVVFCDVFIQSQWKLRGRGNLCDKEGKILHSASIIKPVNWTDEEIERRSLGVHFSVVKTWCKLRLDYGMRTFS